MIIFIFLFFLSMQWSLHQTTHIPIWNLWHLQYLQWWSNDLMKTEKLGTIFHVVKSKVDSPLILPTQDAFEKNVEFDEVWSVCGWKEMFEPNIASI